jgi:hypothetical protein
VKTGRPTGVLSEHRLMVLGGSTAFGYGVQWNEAFPTPRLAWTIAAAPGLVCAWGSSCLRQAS